eukprot:SAG11_NODE_12169_length_718_cov_0.581583_1_plen_99_part_10
MKLEPGVAAPELAAALPYEGEIVPDYSKARDIRRPQCDDFIASIFTDFVSHPDAHPWQLTGTRVYSHLIHSLCCAFSVLKRERAQCCRRRCSAMEDRRR